MSEDASSDPPDRATKARRAMVIVVTVTITFLFLGMIRDFLTALFMAAVFCGMAWPIHRRVLHWLNFRRGLAAGVTLLVMVLIVLLPLLGLTGMIVGQALELSDAAESWFAEKKGLIDSLATLELPAWIPLREHIDLSWDVIGVKLGEFAGRAAKFVGNSLSAATKWTAGFFLNVFVMLYAMYFFLKEGRAIRSAIQQTIPFPDDLKQRLLDKGVSVIRATIKGTLVIGLVQGVLGGVAFAVAGIEGAAFWGLVMAIASVIPGIGTALVWIPAVIYLFATGQTWPAIILGAWCAVVVGTADNVLRPRLVGNDTQMPDLVILVSTFGGLSMFGAIGLILGPAIAALFLLMWDIFAQTFGDTFSRSRAATADSA